MACTEPDAADSFLSAYYAALCTAGVDGSAYSYASLERDVCVVQLDWLAACMVRRTYIDPPAKQDARGVKEPYWKSKFEGMDRLEMRLLRRCTDLHTRDKGGKLFR